MTCPEELRRRYQEGRVVPFVGTGVSMSVRWETEGGIQRGPSWSELVDRATEILGFQTLIWRAFAAPICRYLNISSGSILDRPLS